MSNVGCDPDNLRSRIQVLENELLDLKEQLREEGYIPALCGPRNSNTLQLDEYKRYGRQMLVPEVGMQGQLSLKKTSVLIVGVGGLGCPAAAYLAGAGVGTIGLVDGDTVEVSNLHRQIIHTSERVGMLKVDSAIKYLRQLNPKVTYKGHPAHLNPSASLDIFEHYDLILDCTDHPASRYLISDTAVLAGKTLISASALRTEGQLMVLNNPPCTPGKGDGGFCYRCVFPKPPPADSVVGCGDGGILGPVVGVMGVLMAGEAIKIITARTRAVESTEDLTDTAKQKRPSLLLYSAYSDTQFRSIRLRGKRADCVACSADATISPQSLTSGELNYEAFCGMTASLGILDDKDRVSAKDYGEVRKTSGEGHLLIDVREKVQFDICHIDNSLNVPYTDIQSEPVEASHVDESGHFKKHLNEPNKPIYLICRYGNDSQLAVQKLRALGYNINLKGDVKGGLRAWRRDVDPAFPEY